MYLRHLVLRKIYFIDILFVSVIDNIFLRLYIRLFANTLVMSLIYKYAIVDYGIIELLV